MAVFETADVFRQFAPSYLDAFAERMLPSHRRAIEDIMACRTQAMGGHVYQCLDCGEHFHVYHACRNRSCPACHRAQSQKWLEARTAELLPCPYYHVTVTVPKELREVFRANQKTAYGVLMKAAAQTVMTLCQDKRYMGAQPAILAVLHTWTAKMDYHPHVHLLVSGGGITKDGTAWREAKHPFLIPVRAASSMFRARVHAIFAKRHPDLYTQLPKAAWSKGWVLWCKHWGRGQKAVLNYLARYVHRIAITNTRILAIDAQNVTFRYKERKKSRWRTCTVQGHEFMRRFLQHVLPKGLHKVRYYGLWNPKKRKQQRNARIALELLQPPTDQVDYARDFSGDSPSQPAGAHQTIVPSPEQNQSPTCPQCGSTKTCHKAILVPRPPCPPSRASPTNAN